MRKSMIRIAAIALAVVMLSTCAVTSIFAAYSVSASCQLTLTHTAFGVTVTATKGAENDVTLLPGTSGTLATVNVSGAPSVNATLSFSAESVKISGFTNNVCPVVFTVTNAAGTATTVQMGGEIDTIADLQAALNTAITNCGKTYTAADYSADAPINDTITIAWSWAANSATDANVLDGTITLNLTATVAQSN